MGTLTSMLCYGYLFNGDEEVLEGETPTERYPSYATIPATANGCRLIDYGVGDDNQALYIEESMQQQDSNDDNTPLVIPKEGKSWRDRIEGTLDSYDVEIEDELIGWHLVASWVPSEE